MKTNYVCEWCEEIFSDKGECLIHEKKCFYNPETQSCYTCKHHGDEFANTGKVWFTCDVGLLKSKSWIENFATNCVGWKSYEE
jgi:hypothetical protein